MDDNKFLNNEIDKSLEIINELNSIRKEVYIVLIVLVNRRS